MDYNQNDISQIPKTQLKVLLKQWNEMKTIKSTIDVLFITRFLKPFSNHIDFIVIDNVFNTSTMELVSLK